MAFQTDTELHGMGSAVCCLLSDQTHHLLHALTVLSCEENPTLLTVFLSTATYLFMAVH